MHNDLQNMIIGCSTWRCWFGSDMGQVADGSCTDVYIWERCSWKHSLVLVKVYHKSIEAFTDMKASEISTSITVAHTSNIFFKTINIFTGSNFVIHPYRAVCLSNGYREK